MNDDLISRAAAIDILDAYQVMVENGEENPYAWARLRMSELPPAQPETPMQIGWICPVCGRGLSPLMSVCPCNNGKGWEITC